MCKSKKTEVITDKLCVKTELPPKASSLIFFGKEKKIITL